MDKTLEFSSRLSMSDSHISLADDSSLHILIDTTRQSIANITMKDEFNELNEENQKLKNDIVEMKDCLNYKDGVIDKKISQIKKLKSEVDEETARRIKFESLSVKLGERLQILEQKLSRFTSNFTSMQKK